MAATLANGGIHPLTRERAIKSELVPSVLSVMTSCGMSSASTASTIRTTP
jgi:glutaminase